jgi:hypothetical protein
LVCFRPAFVRGFFARNTKDFDFLILSIFVHCDLPVSANAARKKYAFCINSARPDGVIGHVFDKIRKRNDVFHCVRPASSAESYTVKPASPSACFVDTLGKIFSNSHPQLPQRTSPFDLDDCVHDSQ